MELRLGFTPQPDASEQEGLYKFPQCTILEAAKPRRPPKVLWVKEVEVDESVLSKAGFSGASSLSLSHIITLSDELPLSSRLPANILNKKIVSFFNIALTVKDTNTRTKDMTTLKKYSGNAAYFVNLKLIMY